MTTESFDKLRLNLSVKLKNGIDFTLSASIIWMIIAYVWTIDHSTYDKSIFTFIVGALMFPLAFIFSKLIKINWTNKDNPLQQLGLWLNLAQLFYFPFLFFTLIKMPDYFVMVYIIITGAHLFPYSWYYKTGLYAIFAGIISFGALVIGLITPGERMYFIPLFMSASLITLTILLYFDSKKKQILIVSE
jgi:hypothetical protein